MTVHPELIARAHDFRTHSDTTQNTFSVTLWIIFTYLYVCMPCITVCIAFWSRMELSTSVRTHARALLPNYLHSAYAYIQFNYLIKHLVRVMGIKMLTRWMNIKFNYCSVLSSLNLSMCTNKLLTNGWTELWCEFCSFLQL